MTAPKVTIPQMQALAVASLKPYWNNPRMNDDAVEGLKKSIEQFGFNVPIVVDSDMVIVTGHTRYKASVELGLTEVPVIVATHLNAEQIRAFRIADNRLSENAKWDENKLSDELRQIQDMGFSLEFTGFNKEELDCLTGQISASCLDDMDYATVCGAVSAKATTARDNIVVSVGNYKFYASVEAYRAWEQDLLAEHPKRTDIVNEIMRRLGFTAVTPETVVDASLPATQEEQAEQPAETA